MIYSYYYIKDFVEGLWKYMNALEKEAPEAFLRVFKGTKTFLRMDFELPIICIYVGCINLDKTFRNFSG